MLETGFLASSTRVLLKTSEKSKARNGGVNKETRVKGNKLVINEMFLV